MYVTVCSHELVWAVFITLLNQAHCILLSCVGLFHSTLCLCDSFLSFFFGDRILLFEEELECSGIIEAHYGLKFLGSGEPPSLASQLAGTTVAHHHVGLFFCRDKISPFCPGWSRTSGFKWSSGVGLPRCCNYRHEPPCQVHSCHSALHSFVLLLVDWLFSVFPVNV